MASKNDYSLNPITSYNNLGKDTFGGKWDYLLASSNPISKYMLEAERAGNIATESGRIQRQALEQAQQGYGQAYQDVAGMYDPYSQAGTTALSSLVGGDFSTPVGQFEFQGDVSQYLDPSMAYQQEQASRALQQSALGQGNLLSGGTAKALQVQAQQMAQQDYANAFNRMQQDKSFAYRQFADDFTRRQQENALRMQRLQSLAGMGQSATGAMANARMGAQEGMASLAGDLGQARALEQTGAEQARLQTFQHATDPNRIGGVVGSIFGGLKGGM